MSKAYICDKCGLIRAESMPAVWVVNPIVFDGDMGEKEFSINLCEPCYEQFRREYMENAMEEGAK